MERANNVIEFYVLCNKLKDIVRTGWENWGVKRERVESIAEHIFGVQMLAIAMWSEYNYDVDIKKVITMLAMHETEEILIGDLTCFEISREEKEKIGEHAVKEIFSRLSNAKKLEALIHEFDERKTPEAQFAYFCDKLECDLQAKLYDEQHCVDLSTQSNNLTAKEDATVEKYLSAGETWSGMWMKFGQERYNYDENFTEVSNFALDNDITSNK